MRHLKKQELIELVSAKLRLIRNEYNFTQEKMSELLGISKKTLVQIEKERALASWTLVMAVCGLFRESDVLMKSIGEDPIELIEAISFDHVAIPRKYSKATGFLWTSLKAKKGYIIQRNSFSNHYRIIDSKGKRWYSSFNLQLVEKHFVEMIERRKRDEKEN